VGLGLIHVNLKFTTEHTAKFSDLLTKLPLFWTYFISSIYYSCIVLVGTLLLIVPGIIWGLRYQFFGYLIVDQGLKPKVAFQASKKLTHGHLGKLFLFGLVLLGINLLGALALLVGLLVTIPVSLLAIAKVYRLLSDTLSTGLSNHENSMSQNPVPILPSGAMAEERTNLWKTYRQNQQGKTNF
jgi:uncharacterized membrane protein